MNTHRPWLFDLARFDEDVQPPDTDPGNQDADPETEQEEPEGAAALGDKGKQALDRMKAEKLAAKKEAAAAKKRADELAAKVAEFEDRDKTETEKLAQRAEQAEAQAKAATERAIKAEVKALAASAFEDPTDADLLGDLTKYVAEGGDVDVEAIQADLDTLLERKPHLRKQTGAPAARKQPKPDPSQGPRKDPEPVNYRTAGKDEFEAELRRMGVRTR